MSLVHCRISPRSCQQRFDRAHEAACQCFEAEKSSLRRGGFGAALRQFRGGGGLLGGLEQKFQQCYTDNGYRFPQEKLDAVREAIRDSILDVFMGRSGIPPELKYTLQVPYF